MEVDGEGDEEGAKKADEGGDTETEEQGDMSIDEDGDGEEARPRKQKLKPRKSQINVDAIREEQQVLANLDQRALAELKFTKNWAKNAINFIHQIDGAMEVIVKLLGSKSKAEVLEAIDFFKTVHDFEMSGAQVGFVCLL